MLNCSLGSPPWLLSFSDVDMAVGNAMNDEPETVPYAGEKTVRKCGRDRQSGKDGRKRKWKDGKKAGNVTLRSRCRRDGKEVALSRTLQEGGMDALSEGVSNHFAGEGRNQTRRSKNTVGEVPVYGRWCRGAAACQGYAPGL